MKTILTIGDSFTAVRWVGDKPWPHYLLGEVTNIAFEGMGNTFMFRNAVDQISSNKYTHAVIALSNWDRHEFPKGNSYEIDNDKVKVIRPNKLPKSETAEFEKFYWKWYSPRYYIDLTLSYIVSLKALAKAHNTKLIFLQPIYPFNKAAAFAEVESSNENSQNNTEEIFNYLRDHHMFYQVNSNDFINYQFTPNDIARMRENKNNLNYKFTRSGDLSMQSGNNSPSMKHRGDWDFHPNDKGHRYIAEQVNMWLNE
jgi:hypothetical protein